MGCGNPHFSNGVMQQDIERFLNLRHLPVSVTVEQATAYLGISPHEIPILLAKGLLKPLGQLAPNGQKFFLMATLDELRHDEKWFGRARDAIAEFWQNKSAHRASGQDGPADGEESAFGRGVRRRERGQFPAPSDFQEAVASDFSASCNETTFPS
jgi:hypothetical protein